MVRNLLTGIALLLGVSNAQAASAPAAPTAIIINDRAALRAAPRDSAQQQAVLWQGEAVEIRGERLDYVQVYDHKRERGGFVRASHVRRTALIPAEAPELLSILRFVRDTPGSEALGIGLAAAYIQAAPAEVLNGDAGIEALDALGTFADRLAQRASSGAALSKPTESTLSAHLEVAARYGVTFKSYEREGRMQICYEGDAFRRVLAMRSTPEQRARAALGLTRTECANPELRPAERFQLDQWRADVLDRVEVSALRGYLKNRVLMRRAAVWSSLAYQKARKGEAGDAAANRALTELASIARTELTDSDLETYDDALMRASASRWAALPAIVASSPKGVSVVTAPGQPGETCISVIDAKHDAANPLAKRCTYGLVWTGSTAINRDGSAVAVAVQPMDTWRELWLFRKDAEGWKLTVLPPATTNPEVGYIEFAGWVPGGAQMLTAREARGAGKYKRSFEVVRLDTLAIERQASESTILGAFQRWQDPVWKRQTLSVR